MASAAVRALPLDTVVTLDDRAPFRRHLGSPPSPSLPGPTRTFTGGHRLCADAGRDGLEQKQKETYGAAEGGGSGEYEAWVATSWAGPTLLPVNLQAAAKWRSFAKIQRSIGSAHVKGGLHKPRRRRLVGGAQSANASSACVGCLVARLRLGPWPEFGDWLRETTVLHTFLLR